MHARRQIREALLARLTGLALTGSRVFSGRVNPLTDGELPAIVIATDGEENIQSAQEPVQRTLSFAVRGVARNADDVEDTLDELGEQVEAAVAAGPLLPGKSINTRLIAVAVDLAGDGVQPHGQIVMTYVVDYFTTQAAPGTAL
jgi:predicted metal-dependent phosphoesterase TrpH